jgi:hypothetical protein
MFGFKGLFRRVPDEKATQLRVLNVVLNPDSAEAALEYLNARAWLMSKGWIKGDPIPTYEELKFGLGVDEKEVTASYAVSCKTRKFLKGSK